MFNNIYLGKRVLITGHTGFKGAWLTQWLIQLGAEVCGISNCIPTNPSLFVELKLESQIQHHLIDIRDLDEITEIIASFKPDFIFHLAAQPIVSLSYEDPLETISTNVIGTANVLDAIRKIDYRCYVVIITSDKCYENVEWEWGYKETDHLGGKDIYSASKGAAEIIFHAYYHSFIKNNNNIRIATARAGNVIGGGDWAKDRIIADCVRSWSEKLPVAIRSPDATRPWQHVLEPLSGYLWLGACLSLNDSLNGESFNFGPPAEQNSKVLDLIADVFSYWDEPGKCYEITDRIPFHEAGLLKLNCDKAHFHLKWKPTLKYEECVNFVGVWYNSYYCKSDDIVELTKNQINQYMDEARERFVRWTIM